MIVARINNLLVPFYTVTRKAVKVIGIIAGFMVIAMMSVTVVDVLLRIFKVGITGIYDLVRVFAALAITSSLPYVTAVKGHIAVMFFYEHFSRTGRIILDSIFRVITIIVFGLLTAFFVKYGLSLYSTGEIMPTLNMPVFWIPFIIAINCLLMMIIIFFHLLNPGEEFIKS